MGTPSTASAPCSRSALLKVLTSDCMQTDQADDSPIWAEHDSEVVHHHHACCLVFELRPACAQHACQLHLPLPSPMKSSCHETFLQATAARPHPHHRPTTALAPEAFSPLPPPPSVAPSSPPVQVETASSRRRLRLFNLVDPEQ